MRFHFIAHASLINIFIRVFDAFGVQPILDCTTKRTPRSPENIIEILKNIKTNSTLHISGTLIEEAILAIRQIRA
jgi:hypothetical protein